MMRPSRKPHFVVHFIEARDCPGFDGRHKSNLYIRALICLSYSYEMPGGGTVQRTECLSEIVTTTIRQDCRNAVWNSYRDFRVNPCEEYSLQIQLYHATTDTPKPELDMLLGRTEISVRDLQSESVVSRPLVPIRGADRSQHPNFLVRLRRLFLSQTPPIQKTFFLVRHGESKWNQAQAKINLAGMLDRDHALTEQGIAQAQELNQRWRLHFFKERALPPVPPSSSSAGSASATDGKAAPPPKPARKKAPTPPPIPDLLDFTDMEPSSTATTAPSSSGFPADPFADVNEGSRTGLSHELAAALVTPFETSTTTDTSPPVESDVWSGNDLARHLHRLSLSLSRQTKDLSEVPDEELFGTTAPIDDDDDDTDDECGRSSHATDNGTGKAEATAATSPTIPVPAVAAAAEGEDPRALFSGARGESLPMTGRPNLLSELLDDVPQPASEPGHQLVHKFSDHAEMSQVMDEAQRRHEYMQLFLHADAIFASPLTRALQTAVLSMEGHPATKVGGITLYSVVREIKRMGGLDTVGVACGDQIEHRLRQELAQVLGRERTDQVVSCPIDVNDCQDPWWTALAEHETESEQQARVRELLTFLRYCDAQVPIIVGHSLFFKALYSKRVSSHLLKNRRHLSENLKKFRLSNASMLAVTVHFVDFSLGGGLSEAILMDADVIFGGGFHGATHGASGSSQGSRSVSPMGLLGGRKGSVSQTTAQNGSGAGAQKDLFGGLFSTSVTTADVKKEIEQGRQAVQKNLKKWSNAVKDFLDS